jgi:hypothetical protein
VLPDLESFQRLGGAERDLAYMCVEREMRGLRALAAAMINEVAVPTSYVDDCRHPTAWLQAVTNSTPGIALRAWPTADMLAAFPHLATTAPTPPEICPRTPPNNQQPT